MSPALRSSICPSILAAVDPWQHQRMVSGREFKAVAPYCGRSWEWNREALKRIYRLILEKVDEYAVCCPGTYIHDSTVIRGLDGILYYPKGDRFFVDVKDVDYIPHMYDFLQHTFPGNVTWLEAPQLIQVIV